MNLLYEPLPESVTVGGKAYPVYTDFRDWLRFYDLQEEDRLSRQDKLLMMLGWFKEMPPVELIEEALHALIAFAANTEIRPGQKATSAPKSTEQILAWSYDAPYIYAAFLSVYRIDLLTVKYMHWHVFLSLLNGLPEDVPLKKRIGYRTIHPAEIKDKERKKQLLKIKNSVRIPHKPLDAQATGEFFG